jgi:phospholipid/cholesterol/gamma-HCH transport system ATP-binding protein
VQINRVSFGYDERLVLDQVSLQFPKGKVIAIMGNSGCGKTTLLRLIGGLITPASGEVMIDGQVLDPLNRRALYAIRRRMGMLFQFGALFTDLSVFDNVAFPLRENTDLSESMIQDLVLLKLEAVGLRGAASMRISDISGGMARRVALARTVALDPEVILYDEPFTGLDPIAMSVTASLIRRLNDATGATSIVVSHDVQECFEICDFAYLLSAGRVIAQGTPDDLRASSEPEVRQFIRGEIDGPVRFHFPAPPLAQALGVTLP